MQTLKFALPDWLEPEETVKRLKEEYNKIGGYPIEIGIERWNYEIVKQEDGIAYFARSEKPIAFYYLGMAVSRILE